MNTEHNGDAETYDYKDGNAQQAKLNNNYKNTKLKLLNWINQWVFFLKCDFGEEQCSSLKMILGLKHVGAILNVLI